MKVHLPSETKTVNAEIVSDEELKHNVPQLVKTSEGLSKLEKLLEKQFPQEMLVKYIKDLCEAEDIKMTKFGDEFRTPNWEARKNGLDRVLELLRYKNKDAVPAGQQQPIKLIFNVVNPQVEVKK